MFSTKPFKSILDLVRAFPDEQSCIEHLEFVRWQGNVVSPFQEGSKVYKVKGNRYKCAATNAYFNVRTGTIFEGSKIPLLQWFIAIFLFTSHKRGISSHQLAKDLNITQKSAWFMLQRIRYAMEHETFVKHMEGEIQVDETFVGGKNKNRHHNKKVEKSQGRSFKDKTPVLGLLEREESEIVERPHKVIEGKTVKEKVVTKEGKISCYVVPDTKAESIQPLIRTAVAEGSTIVSDEWMAYNGLSNSYNHQIVDHKSKQYVNEGGYTTNGMENGWTHFKKTIGGTYINVSRKHLQKYANEFTFRYNSKGNETNKRFDLLLTSTIDKRLTYQKLIEE